MDSFEKLMKSLYQEKKADDEQSMPDFESVVDRLHQTKPEAPIRAINIIWKLAASTAAVGITAMLVWRSFDRESSKKIPLTIGHHPISSYAAAATDRLLDDGSAMTHIWDWQSPTEALLHLHHESANDKKIMQ